MAEEASREIPSQNPVPDLIEWISSTDDKIKRKKHHLVEVIWNHRNEEASLQDMLLQLRQLEGTFSGDGTIKEAFREFRETIEKRCTELKEKLEKLDVILKEVGVEEEKVKRFTEQAQNIEPETPLSLEEKKESCRSLKQEVDEWYINIQLKFKEGKKLNLSLIRKNNVEDVCLSLDAWRNASKVTQEYGQKIAQTRKDAEIKERQMREQIKAMEADVSGLKAQNSFLDDQVKNLKDKIDEGEREFFVKQELHEEIARDLKEKLGECQEKLREEKRLKFEMEIEIGKIKEKLKQTEVHEGNLKELEGKIVNLRESVAEGERLREEAEKLVLGLQEELQDLNEEVEERVTLGKKDDGLKRVFILVKTLKKTVEGNERTIKHLESERRREGDRNEENVDEIEKLLSAVEKEQNSKEERGRLIETIRSLLHEKEKLTRDLELKNIALRKDVTEEGQRVTEVRERTTELQESVWEEKSRKFSLEMETTKLKDKWQQVDSMQEFSERKIEVLQKRNEELENENRALKESLAKREKSREDTERRLFEIQSELLNLDEEEEGAKIDLGRVNSLVKTLKKRLEDNEEYIQNLESKICQEEHRSEENVEAIEKLLRKVENEEKGKDERDKVIDTIRGLLEENEKYSTQLESENEGLRKDIARERQTIAKLQETVGDLEQNVTDCKCTICQLEVENVQTKVKLNYMASTEELSQEKIQMLEDRKKKLNGDVEALQKNLFDAKRGKETAEKMIFEIQGELQDLDEEYGEEKTGHKKDGVMRANVLVFMLKRKLQDSKGAIEMLESEIQGKRIRNQENMKDVEKLFSEVGLKEQSGEEQRLVRGLLDENEVLVAKIETQNTTLNASIALERQRVMELRDRVGHLQQSSSELKNANFEMEMEIEKLRNQIEDEESKNELNLKKTELLQKEINFLLDTIKGKVQMIEQLRSQVSNSDRIKEKLEVERKRNEDNSQRIEELQNKMVLKENALDETEAEVRKMTEELKDTKEKLESVDIDLGWIKENNDLLSGVLKEKDRNLQEDFTSEGSTQVEYILKCKMLENTENTRVIEMAEMDLQKEREQRIDTDKKLMKLREEVEEERKKDIHNGSLIQEVEDQLLEAAAMDQYNPGIKLSSTENIMEAENQNEQLLSIIEDVQGEVNEKELETEEYAVEELRERDELTLLRDQQNLANSDCRTKSEIIKYLRNEIERMRNVMRIKESVFGDLEGEKEAGKIALSKVQSLELERAKMKTRYEMSSRNPHDEGRDFAVQKQNEEVRELLEILASENEKNAMYEDMIKRLEEMVRLQEGVKDVNGSDPEKTEKVNESRREVLAKKEEYLTKKRHHTEDKLIRLEKMVEDLRVKLRAEQRNVRDRDNLISTLNEASKRDVARNDKLSAQLQDVQQKALQQLRHSEEMTKKFEDGQGLIRELEAEADKERLRASTIEIMMSSEKEKSAEEKSVIQDLKCRVEEYQKTVNDIKRKVDKINRQLRWTSPGPQQAARMSSPDVFAQPISGQLASHGSFISELKAKETGEGIKADIKNQIDISNRQEQKIDDLLSKSVEYDRLVAETKSELDEIRKRYHELSGHLAPDEDEYNATDARTESLTKLVRSMPEHELSKQLSSFEELLETIFSEEAQRIEQIQNKLDDVFNMNVEFSTALCEVREEEGRIERRPWNLEREELRTKLSTREDRIKNLQLMLEKEEITKDGLEKKIAAFEEKFNEKERIVAALQFEIQEAEKSIFRQKELTEKKKCNFDQQERAIKETQDILQESGENLDEIQIKAKESCQESSQEFALEKPQKEKRVIELEDEVIKQGVALGELRENLDKEQNYVFELTESLEVERDQCNVKGNAIDEMRKELEKEKEKSKQLRRLLDEAEDRALRLSEALTNEQVTGREREDVIQHLKERINEEQTRLGEARDALDEEIQLANQLKERLSVEQHMKSEFERELDRINAKFAEEQHTQISIKKQLQRGKNIIYETEYQLRQQEDDAGQSKKMIEELKTDLETERTCYKMLSERLVSEQSRIVELEMQLREMEAIMRSDKDLLDRLRERCLRGEEMHFNLIEKLEKAEKLNKEKDEEINSLINELATEKMRIDGLLTSLEDKTVSKAQLEERVTALEEIIARDELLFQELRVKIDSEVDKNRELVEEFDNEKVKGSMYEERIRELETQVTQDGELFEELKRTIDIEREQSRRLDALLQEEKSETARRDAALAEFEQLLLSERKSKDELKVYLESEMLSNSDVHEKQRPGEGKQIEKNLTRDLESALESEQLKAFEIEKANQGIQKELEEKDYWLKQIAEELASDMEEDSQCSTDESESRGYDERDNTKNSVFEEPEGGSSQLEDLLGKIIAGRNARKRVNHKAKARKRRMAEKEKIIEDINRSHEDETRRMKEESVSLLEQQAAFLQESENRLKIITDERDGYRKDCERLRGELEKETSRRHYFEVLLAEQQTKNQSLDTLVESLKNKATEGCEQINSAAQQLEKQMRESKEKQEENKRLRQMCDTQEDKMEKLTKELENYKILYQEKDFVSQETLQQVEELRKQLEEIEHDIDQKNRSGEVRQRSRFVEVTLPGGNSKEVMKSLRKELENVRKVVHSNVSELERVRRQLREKEEENTKLKLENENQQKSVQLLRDMQDRSEMAEWQLTKLQLTYNLLVNDVEMKKCLVEESNNEATRLRALVAEKEILINDLKENVKSSVDEKEKIISDIRESAKMSLREKEIIISEMKKNAEAYKTKDVCANENEQQKLRMTLKQNQEHIQDLTNEYNSKLARKDAELLDVQLSLDIMKTVYQGLQAEKERENVLKNAERTQRKSKEDLNTATAMVRDIQRQICDLQAAVLDEKQLARSLDEENRAAKLPNESEKSYLKRRSSLRSILSFQIDEKEKKMKRLKMLVNTIENRHGKELFGLAEGPAVNDEEDNQVGSSWEQTEKGPLPKSQVKETLSEIKDAMRECASASTDLLREENSMENVQNKRKTKQRVETISAKQSNYDERPKDRREDQTSSLSLSKREILAATLLGVIVGTTPFCLSPPVAGFVLAFFVIPLVFLLSAHQSRGTVKNSAMLQKALLQKEKQERDYLDKIEEMSIRIEGDCNLIQELKKQLEDELTEKEAKQIKVDEIMAAKESAFDRKGETEDFDTKMQREIEKAKLLEAEKRKKSFEEYKVLREEVDCLKREREAELNKNQSRFAELEQVAVVSDGKSEYGINRVNIPLSVLPVCLGISVVLWQLMGYHFTAPHIILTALVTFATNSWYSGKKVAQRLTEERQKYEEQHEELEEMTQILDTQFEVVKSQKSAIDMLVKEIEKEQLERREKRNTFAKLIWQLQEMDSMQNLIAKESSRTSGATGLEIALRTKAEENALERARFYNNMITTLKEISADEMEDYAMTDDLCETAQELADYAEDQLEEQKKREIDENRIRLTGKKGVGIPWKTISLATVHTGALAASIALQSYIVAGLVALQAFIYGLQRRDGSSSRHARSEEVDKLKMQLRRESARNRSLLIETEKLKALLKTEKTYKMSDEFALEIKEKRKAKKSC